MTKAGPGLLGAYANALREHAHCLIAEGYARMDKAAFAREHEPAITGELVRAMRAFLEAGSSAPAWACFYSIHDDPPLDIDGRRGSSRPRVDIEFECMAVGKRPRLCFEAKRLCSRRRHTVAGYLGQDGLGCFLSGRYPTTHGEAGMLAYVQSGEESDWAERIAAHLNADEAEHRTMLPRFASQRAHATLQHTYTSHHLQRQDGKPIVIHHVLLRFR